MSDTYSAVVEAANSLVTANTRDTWVLADAVLGHVPDQGKGGGDRMTTGGRESLGAPKAEKLADLALSLEADGIVTPRGDTYSVDSLAELRKTSMAWPKTTRHLSAAYRTHQEANSPNTLGGRVLAALCKQADGKKVKAPEGADPGAFGLAVEMVMRAIERDSHWTVSVNTLRVALQKKQNVPTRMTDEIVAAIDVITHNPAAIDALATKRAQNAEFRRKQEIAEQKARLDETRRKAAKAQSNINTRPSKPPKKTPNPIKQDMYLRETGNLVLELEAADTKLDVFKQWIEEDDLLDDLNPEVIPGMLMDLQRFMARCAYLSEKALLLIGLLDPKAEHAISFDPDAVDWSK